MIFFALRRRVPAVLMAASTTGLKCLNCFSSCVRLSFCDAVLKRNAASTQHLTRLLVNLTWEQLGLAVGSATSVCCPWYRELSKCGW